MVACRLFYSIADDSIKSRAWTEYGTTEALAVEMIGHFEDYRAVVLKAADTAYTSDELFDFIEVHFGELVCLIEDKDTRDLWIPYGKGHIKLLIYDYIRSLSEREQMAEELEPKQSLFDVPSCGTPGEDRVRDKIDKLLQFDAASTMAEEQDENADPNIRQKSSSSSSNALAEIINKTIVSNDSLDDDDDELMDDELIY